MTTCFYVLIEMSYNITRQNKVRIRVDEDAG